jgi:hypothetical protein
MLRLQGFPLTYRVPPQVTVLKMGALLGNSMCIAVMRPLLRAVLIASGLLVKS